MNWKKIVLACCSTVLAMDALAHIPYIESDMVRRNGTPVAAEDFSFDTPFVIDGDVQDSRAIFSSLRRNDVDVFEFTVSLSDIGSDPFTGSPTPLVSASALPPACKSHERAYPSTALVGPGLPPADPSIDLPFDVPPSLGVIVAENPKVPHGTDRAIFVSPEADYAWFLPLGLTQDCLTNSPWLCDMSNTISTPVFVPSTYQIVIWNPTGKEIDYTANIGFLELNYDETRAEVITPLVDGYKLLCRQCTDGYPNR